MPTFEQALSEYGKAIKKEMPFPALLGAYINGAFRIVVPTNPALAYVRHLDNTPATAYHHNNVDLTLDVTVAANQNKAISLYFDEYDHLAIWGLAPPEAGANLQSDPNTGSGGVKAVVAGLNVTVDNTDPTRPVVSSTGGGGGGSASLLLDYTASTDLFNATSITANTWTDVNSNQSFTVTNGSALIEFAVICNLLISGTGSSSVALRLVIDSAGTPVYKQLVGVRAPAGDYGAAPGGVVKVTGLSAAAHTVKVQIQITSAGTAYLRANTVPDFENLAIQVTQL